MKKILINLNHKKYHYPLPSTKNTKRGCRLTIMNTPRPSTHSGYGTKEWKCINSLWYNLQQEHYGLLLFFLGFLWLWASTTWAQENSGVLTLRFCEDRALQHNTGILSSRFETQQTEKNRLKAATIPNPTLVVNADILPAPGEVFAPASKQYGISLAFELELGGKRGHRVEVAESEYSEAQYQTMNIVRETLRDVRLAYYDVILWQQYVQLADSNVGLYRRVAELNQKRHEQGSIGLPEVLRSQIAVEQALLQRDDYEVQRRAALAVLYQMMGDNSVPYKVNVVVQAEFRDSAVYPVDNMTTLVNRAYQQRPDYRSAEAGIQTSGFQTRLQDAQATPTVLLAADASMQQGTLLYGVTTSFPLPLFDQNQGEREKARIGELLAEQRREKIRQKIHTELYTAWEEYHVRKKALDTYRTGSPILDKVRTIRSSAEFAYQNGNIPLIELLETMRTYHEMMMHYHRVVIFFQKSMVQLYAALGEDSQTK